MQVSYSADGRRILSAGEDHTARLWDAADGRLLATLQGHTDATGSKETNYRLGEERAEAVRRYLNEHGVALNRIGTISYGADVPAQPNNNRAGRQANRRVVLIVLT